MCIECVCAHVLSINTYCEAVVDILSAGLCNTGIRQIHLIKDKRLQRRDGVVVVEERKIQKAGKGTEENTRVSLWKCTRPNVAYCYLYTTS